MSRREPELSRVADYGADCGKYNWTQTQPEVTITIPLPSGTKGKDIFCKLGVTKVQFGLKGEPLIIDGDFCFPIKVDDSTWTYEAGAHEAQLILAKRDKEQWWKSAIVGEGEIDVDLIEGSKFLDDSLLRKVKEAKAQQKQSGQAATEAAPAGGAGQVADQDWVAGGASAGEVPEGVEGGAPVGEVDDDEEPGAPA